jgi:hypothetical protein
MTSTSEKAPAKKKAGKKKAAGKKTAGKVAKKKTVVASQVEDFDDLAYLDEFVVEAKEEDAAMRRGNKIFLRPTKDQRSRSTLVRPVFWKGNKFGQVRPIVFCALHERLDEPIPGTSDERLLFPHIAPGVRTVPCIEPRANRRAKKIQFCPSCKRMMRIMSFEKQLGKKAQSTHDSRVKKFSRALGTYVGYAKAGDYVGFVAIHHIPKKWEKHDKLIIPMVERNGIWVPAGPDDVPKKKVYPIGVVMEKRFYGKHIINTITAKAMPKEVYEEENGVELSEAEWQRIGPRARPSPFSLKEGWSMSIKFEGKMLDTEVTVTPAEPKPLTKAQWGAVKALYPDIMEELKIPGTNIVPLEYGEWRAENPKGSSSDYAVYLKGLAGELEKVLGIDKEGDGEGGEVKISAKRAIAAMSGDLDEEESDEIDAFDVGEDDDVVEGEEGEVPF